MTHLIIAGVADAGPRAVGRILAERLGLPFVECDVVIAETAGKSVARIRAEEGEQALRTLEARVVLQLLHGESAVLAVRDDTLGTTELREAAKCAGMVVSLSADPSAIDLQVHASSGQRPFTKVAEPLAKIRELLDTRQADVQVDTTSLPPADVAGQVLDWLNRVHVNLGDRSYDITIESGCHAGLGAALTRLPRQVSAVALISNRQVDAYYGDTIRTSLDGVGLRHHTLLVPAGERYKSLDTANRLFGDLIQRKIDRHAVVVAVGGGVIGDLAGFVAATYQRGIRFMQVPTSLLAQVDSSIGGKVGVNHPLGKNMIGAFLQPQQVLIDPGVLSTLPLRELRSGLAEVVKYGVIWDEDFFAYLEGHVDHILRLDPQAITHIIRRSCQIKAHVVEEDETESGLRAILNLGHTAAHAVETYTSYERFTHGEAVAVGMVVAARIAHGMGLLRAEAVHRLIRLLERYGLPTHLPKADPGVLMSLMDTDKKAQAGKIRFVLPVKIGRVEITSTVPRDILRRAIKESIGL